MSDKKDDLNGDDVLDPRDGAFSEAEDLEDETSKPPAMTSREALRKKLETKVSSIGATPSEDDEESAESGVVFGTSLGAKPATGGSKIVSMTGGDEKGGDEKVAEAPAEEASQGDVQPPADSAHEEPSPVVATPEEPAAPKAPPPVERPEHVVDFTSVPVEVAEVRTVLEDLAQIAAASGMKLLQSEIQDDRLRALEEGRITMVVLGEFNHGKSTVINALLGDDILPVGITPTTAVITHLVWGPKPYARIYPGQGADPISLPMEELDRAVRNPDNEKEPEYVEIEYPNDFLGRSLVLVDTPGVNDISRQKVEITYGYVPRADVILYVLDATQVLKKSEVVFIQDRLLKANRDRIIFVLGKIDALAPRDAKEVEIYARERLEKILGPVEIFPLSARDAAEAIAAGKSLPESFQKFRDYVASFVDEQRAYIIIDSALGGAQRVATLMEQNLSIKRRGYDMELDELIKSIDAVQAKLDESRRLIASNIDHIRERTGGIKATARHNLRQFTQRFQESLPLDIERADARDVKRYLPDYLQDTFKEWLEDEGAVIAHELEILAEEVIQITNESMREAMTILQDELGFAHEVDLEVDTMAYDVSVYALGAAGLLMIFANVVVGGLLTLATPLLAFVLRDRVDAKIKERAREEAVRAVTSASDAIEKELLRTIDEFGARLENFVETAGDRLYRQIEEVLGQVRGEIEAGGDRKELRKEVDTRLSTTRVLKKTIEIYRKRLLPQATEAS